MALEKKTVSINFQKGIDTKPDPNQLEMGSFVDLENSVFDKLGQLTKRNGFGALTSLPSPANFLTTFKENLIAVGSKLQAYVKGSNTWVNSGTIQPLQLSTLPLVRNSVNQTQADSVVSTNGLVCTVYTETTGASTLYKYVVADSTTGQNVVAPTVISSDPTYGTPRVYLLGTYFIIVFTTHPAAYNLSYIAVNTGTLTAGSSTVVSTSVTPSANLNFDGVVFNNTLYLAWVGAAASGIKIASLTSTLVLSSSLNPDAAHSATVMSVTADATTSLIWVSYYNFSTSSGYAFAVAANTMATYLAPTQIISFTAASNIASAATGGINTIFYETANVYSYDSSILSNFISSVTITNAGAVSAVVPIIKSLGLASKAFVVSGNVYFLGAYSSPYQKTYFLIPSSSATPNPKITAQLAYGNGGGYVTAGLPSANVIGTTVQIAYLIADLVQSVNKGTAFADPTHTQTAGIYTQTGVNLANFNFSTSTLATTEIGNNLNATCGYLVSYDGLTPVEHNFFLYPDSIEATWSATGGFMAANPSVGVNTNAYYYQVLYRSTDAQGNVFRSACSIPIAVTTTGSGTAGSVTIYIPTLRVTFKTNVIIEVYRWSVGQQSYYQVGNNGSSPVTSPFLNNTTVDYLTFTDKSSDATILGNSLLYTTGGVLEDVSPPAFNAITLFDTRLWGIDAEDPNLLWFSKIVIEATPVEMSPLQTIYIAPNISEKQNTGPMKCIFPMDDKIIIFKASTLYYINGTGPDATGANSQYSEPTFITSPVGCANPNSIILVPEGLMFQSLKGIWILKRNLTVNYIGAPAEAYNSANVLSAIAIPNANRVVFTLDNGISLMYDYYVGQWGTYNGIAGISSTVYNGLHTFLSAPITVSPPGNISYTTASQVYQETPGVYLDGPNPTLMAFTTGWISMAGLQGYKRAYWLYILATYFSPHKFTIGVSYDFNSSIVQLALVTPGNSTGAWGGDDIWGVADTTVTVTQETWGGSSSVEQWQINFQYQTCQAFQLTFNELYDATKGIPAGAGLTMSAMELVAGISKGFPRNIPATNKTG